MKVDLFQLMAAIVWLLWIFSAGIYRLLSKNAILTAEISFKVLKLWISLKIIFKNKNDFQWNLIGWRDARPPNWTLGSWSFQREMTMFKCEQQRPNRRSDVTLNWNIFIHSNADRLIFLGGNAKWMMVGCGSIERYANVLRRGKTSAPLHPRKRLPSN